MIRRIGFIAGLTLITVGCARDEIAKDCQQAVSSPPTVTVIHSPNGLGDRGYNDLIFAGVQVSQKKHDFRLLTQVPDDMQEAELFFEDWLNDSTASGKQLLIMASSDFEYMIRSHKHQIPDDEQRKVLFLESRAQDLPAYTLYLPLYGACYQAGCVSLTLPYAAMKSAVVCANRLPGPIADGRQGFQDGFLDNGGLEVDTVFLADDDTGYAMANQFYQLCFDLEKEYAFVFPLAGGSNQGLLRFTREYPRTFYTAGMDVDQSDYSYRVAFSVVKHIDRTLELFLNLWMNEQDLPRNMSRGLASGDVEVVITSGYEDFLKEVLDACKNQAIEKEKAYEKNIFEVQ